jgi:homoserine O-acetyltransferase
MDTHDVARDRTSTSLGSTQASTADETLSVSSSSNITVPEVLATLPRGSLVIGVETDGLFTPNEQEELAEHIPDAEFIIIKSKDGHDGFLLEFEEINRWV